MFTKTINKIKAQALPVISLLVVVVGLNALAFQFCDTSLTSNVHISHTETHHTCCASNGNRVNHHDQNACVMCSSCSGCENEEQLSLTTALLFRVIDHIGDLRTVVLFADQLFDISNVNSRNIKSDLVIFIHFPPPTPRLLI